MIYLLLFFCLFWQRRKRLWFPVCTARSPFWKCLYSKKKEFAFSVDPFQNILTDLHLLQMHSSILWEENGPRCSKKRPCPMYAKLCYIIPTFCCCCCWWWWWWWFFLSDGDVVNASVRSSRYLLIHFWAEFKQTCYVTSPYGKGVWVQYYFSVSPRSICSSGYLFLNN